MIKQHIKKLNIVTMILISILILFLSGCSTYRQNNFKMFLENSIAHWNQEITCFQVDLTEINYNNESTYKMDSILKNHITVVNDSLLYFLSPIYIEYNKNNLDYWIYTKNDKGNYLRRKNNIGKDFVQQRQSLISYYKWLVYFAEMPNSFEYDTKTKDYKLLVGKTKFLYKIYNNGKTLDNNDKREYSVCIKFAEKKVSSIKIDDPFRADGRLITQKFAYEQKDISLPSYEDEII